MRSSVSEILVLRTRIWEGGLDKGEKKGKKKENGG